MINLIPNDLRTERSYGRKNRVLVWLVIAFIATAMMVAATIMISLMMVDESQSELQASVDKNTETIEKLQIENGEVNSTADRLDKTYTIFEDTVLFSEVITEIASILPPGVVLNNLSLTGGSTDPLSINVDLVSAEIAPTLQKNIVNSELFEAADINAITATSADLDSYGYTATLTASFTGSEEAKQKAAAAARAAAEARAAESSEGDE